MDNQFKGHETEHKSAEPFKTPEQMAVKDSQATASPLVSQHNYVPPKPPKDKSKRRFNFKFKLWPPNKYTWITAAVVVVLF